MAKKPMKKSGKPSAKKPKKKSSKKRNCPPQLTSMIITWCDSDCNEWEQEVDLTVAGGLVWDNSAEGKAGPKGPHDPKAPRLPKRGKPKPTGGDCDGSPPGGPSCCWWDGKQWVCPDGF